MESDLGHYRKNYNRHKLTKETASNNPMELFQKWFHEAETGSGGAEVNPMTLSTLDADGYPSNRIVLLKRFTWEGFIFYTNYNSDKGESISRHPQVCLSFFWPVMERQVIIRGKAEKIASNLYDGYFETRPKGSQLGAWASEQSAVVPTRGYLDQRLKDFEVKFEGKEVPRPPHWGGFLVRPELMEFWQGRSNRMHDRILFTLQENYEWKVDRLAP
jgi:pyridoxamine 5'-phosphate oxidase